MPPHLKCVATLPCEMSSVFKATIENKTTSVATHFKEINKKTCLLSPLMSKVTVTSCRSSAGILHGCLRQDVAPSHTARNTQTYLRRENVTFIEPHMWPPNSPDLNPVDCAVWGALQQMVYERRRYTRQSTSWCRQSSLSGGKLLQRFIDRAIGQWRRRLE